MSGLSITCSTKGGAEIVEKLLRVQKEIIRPAPESQQVLGVAVVREIQRGIRNQISPGGAPYPAVLRFGQPGKRLIDTNRLVNSLTYEIRGARSLAVGTNVIYAATGHFGSEPGGRTPKSSKLLAIPMTRAIARAYKAGISLREQYPDAFIFRSLSQGLYLVRRRPGAARGSKSQLEFLFKLVPKVIIPGTGFLGIGRGGELIISELLYRRFGQIVLIGRLAA